MTKSKGMTKDMDPRLHGDDRKGHGDDRGVVIPDLIGNPESFERPKEEWIPFFKGMTKKQGNDKRYGSPFARG
jgi:hypothetical protein